MKIFDKLFCKFKYYSYICSVIKERLQRRCLMPIKEKLTPTNLITMSLNVVIKVWKVRLTIEISL